MNTGGPFSLEGSKSRRGYHTGARTHNPDPGRWSTCTIAAVPNTGVNRLSTGTKDPALINPPCTNTNGRRARYNPCASARVIRRIATATNNPFPIAQAETIHPSANPSPGTSTVSSSAKTCNNNTFSPNATESQICVPNRAGRAGGNQG